MIREWIQRQRDREANGENWHKAFSLGVVEFGVAIGITEYKFGIEAFAVDGVAGIGIGLGPFWIGGYKP